MSDSKEIPAPLNSGRLFTGLFLAAYILFLVDLLTGKSTRITSVKPGQYALYPHFRADNWIYFVVRTTEGKAAPDGGNHEYFVASDAALLLEASDH